MKAIFPSIAYVQVSPPLRIIFRTIREKSRGLHRRLATVNHKTANSLSFSSDLVGGAGRGECTRARTSRAVSHERRHLLVSLVLLDGPRRNERLLELVV